jgi:hypothetical protein
MVGGTREGQGAVLDIKDDHLPKPRTRRQRAIDVAANTRDEKAASDRELQSSRRSGAVQD